MKTCKYCKKEFEPYMDLQECWSCDGEGIEEVPNVYYMGDDDEYVQRRCHTCKGGGTVNILEDQFCCGSCCEEYFEEQFFDI